MIIEKYTQLLLAHQIRGLTTIGVTHKLCVIIKERTKYETRVFKIRLGFNFF